MATTTSTLPHMGKLIKRHLEDVGMTKSEFARRVKTSPQNIYGIFKRKSVDAYLLYDISKVLNFDFSQYFSINALIIKGSDHTEVVSALDLKKELDALKKDFDIIKNENDYLKEIHLLLKEKEPSSKKK